MARVRIRLSAVAVLVFGLVSGVPAFAQAPTPAPSPTAAPTPTVTPAPAPTPAATPTTATPPQDPAATAPTSSQAGSSKVFNPDISVNGNFVAVGGKNPMSTQPPLQLSEAEMAFQAVVDPYARADFFFSAGPEGFAVEEGFITFNTLPGKFLVKVG